MNKTFLSQSSTKLIYAGCILLYLLSMSYFIFFNKVDRGPTLIYFCNQSAAHFHPVDYSYLVHWQLFFSHSTA